MHHNWRANLKSIAWILLIVAGLSCRRSPNETSASLANAASPTPRSESPDAELVRLATEFYDSHTSKCGDTTIALVTWIDGSGSRVFEINKPIVRTKSLPVTEAERLNGLTAQASAWLEASALRSAYLNADSWSPWEETGAVNFPVLLVKRTDAPWQVTPTYSQRGEDGSLEKFPCDGVPGHPARLAREQAERDRLQRAADAEAQRQEEERRKHEALVAESRSLTNALGSFQCTQRADGMAQHFMEVELRTYRFTIRESSIARELIDLSVLKGTAWSNPPDGTSETVWFDELAAPPAVWRSSGSIYSRYLSLKTTRGAKEWYCSSDSKTRKPPTELEPVLELLNTATASWRSRYPTLAHW